MSCQFLYKSFFPLYLHGRSLLLAKLWWFLILCPIQCTIGTLQQKGKSYRYNKRCIDRYFDQELEEKEEKERGKENMEERQREKYIENLRAYFVSYVPDCIYTHICVELKQIPTQIFTRTFTHAHIFTVNIKRGSFDVA